MSGTDMKTGSDPSTTDAVQTILKEAGLQQLKRRFDPDGVFSSAISLPLQKAA